MKTLPKIQLGTKRLWWQGTKLPTMLLFATALHTSTVLTCTEIHINDRKRLDLDASRGATKLLVIWRCKMWQILGMHNDALETG